jgi:hypothetical protein
MIGQKQSPGGSKPSKQTRKSKQSSEPLRGL